MRDVTSLVLYSSIGSSLRQFQCKLTSPHEGQRVYQNCWYKRDFGTLQKEARRKAGIVSPVIDCRHQLRWQKYPPFLNQSLPEAIGEINITHLFFNNI